MRRGFIIRSLPEDRQGKPPIGWITNVECKIVTHPPKKSRGQGLTMYVTHHHSYDPESTQRGLQAWAQGVVDAIRKQAVEDARRGG